MSIFRDKKTYYFSSTFHLSEPDYTEMRDVVLDSVINGGSLAEAIQQLALSGMNNQVAKLQGYAKNGYTLGLPKVQHTKSFTLPDATIAGIIAQNIGHLDGVKIEFQYTSPMVEALVVAPHLFHVRGFKYDKTITKIPSAYAKPTIHPRAKVTCTLFSIEADELFSAITITYKIDEFYYGPTLSRYATEVIPVPAGVYPNREYYIVGYQLLDAEGVPGSGPVQWWYYDLAADLYPEICPENSIEEGNNLLPVIPLRYRNRDLTREEVRDTKLYKTSKTALNMLNINIDDVAARINENPDVAEIDHAYIMFGVDVQTEEIYSLKYLVAFFDYVIDKALINDLDFYKSLFDPNQEIGDYGGARPYSIYDFMLGGIGVQTPEVTNSTTILVNDTGTVTVSSVTGNPDWGAFEEFGLNMSIGYNSIRSEVLMGAIGPVGHVTKTLVRDEDTTGYFKAGVPDGSAMVLCEQITATTYRRISVFGLFLSNYINYPRGVTTTLTKVIDNPDEHGLVIPLHYNVVRQMRPLDRNNVYKDTLILILNSEKTVRLKWYESSFFKFIIQAAAVIYGIITLPTGVGPASAVAIIQVVATRVVIAIVVNLALNAIASWIGPEATMIVAAVTAIAAITYGDPSMSITVPGSTLPTAVSFLDLSLALMNSANVEIQRQIGKVGKAQAAFNKEKEVLLEKLEEAEKLLPDTDTMVDVTNLLGARTHSATLWQAAPGDPEKFYELTIHTGNIGVLALSGPSTFYDRVLSLPEPDIRMRR